MSQLKTNEKQILEKLFQMGGGYVLNFSDRTITEFFKDNLQVDFYSSDFNYGSGSKANRMRGFWAAAPDSLVAKSIRELIEYIRFQILLEELAADDFPDALVERALQVAEKLDGGAVSPAMHFNATGDEEFLKKEFDDLELSQLGLDTSTESIVAERIEEVQKCLRANAPLSVVFLCGSTLEGVLLSAAKDFPKQFNQASAAPKNAGNVLPLHDWKLVSLIDVGREVGLLGEDVKKHSHALRDFRNYIHPMQQLSTGFSPHKHTAKISWQVLQAAIYEISEYRKRNK